MPPRAVGQEPLVLHVRVVTGSGGGPDKTILHSAPYANRASIGMASAYICPHNDEGAAELAHQAWRRGCRLWRIGESGPADPRTATRLLGLCRRLGVSIWHGHDYKSNLYGLMLRRWWPMKLVTTVHGWTWHTTRTKLYYHVDNWCLPRYDQVIAVNTQLADHCLRRGVVSDRLTVVANAIDPAEYTRRAMTVTARANLGIDPDALVIGTVGRLSVEKGADRAIRLIAALRKDWPRAQLHLVGDGPERDRLKMLARELGVAQAVRFWGWQQKSQPFYEMMDVLLLPSHTEGLPNVILEAMAMGVPVAATDVGGVGDLLDHGHCGVILSQDQNTWAPRLSYLLASTDRRKMIAQLARARVESRYTFEHRMDQVFGVYERVLGRSLRPAVSQPAKKAA